jgi:hypothetical protein
MSSHGTALSLGQFAELVAAVTRNLPRDIDPDIADCWVRNGKALAKVLQGSLCSAAACFPTWKTVELGAVKNAKEYHRVLEEVGVFISGDADAILSKQTYTDRQTVVELVVLSVADLGFKKTTTYGDVCTRALKLGLELCPAEVGPILRLIYMSQPDDDGIIIAMEPFSASDGTQHIFALWQCLGRIELLANYGNPEFPFNPDRRLVFVRPHAK